MAGCRAFSRFDPKTLREAIGTLDDLAQACSGVDPDHAWTYLWEGWLLLPSPCAWRRLCSRVLVADHSVSQWFHRDQREVQLTLVKRHLATDFDDDRKNRGRWEHDHKLPWVRAFLECAFALRNQTTEIPCPDLTPDLRAHLSELARDLELSAVGDSSGIMWDIAHGYLTATDFEEEQHGRPAAAETTVIVPFYSPAGEGEWRGVLATLTVGLLPHGSGALYPDPAMAFVKLDEGFVRGLEDCRTYLKRVRLWPHSEDVRWRLERCSKEPIYALRDGSATAGFLLAIAHIVARQGLAQSSKTG